MPRTCTTCRHPQRPAIDRALVAGDSVRDIAGRFGLAKSAVDRHKQEHIAREITRVKQAKDAANALDIVGQLSFINAVALNLLADAGVRSHGDTRPKDPAVALRAAAEVRKQLELQARLLGDLSDAPQVHLTVAISAQWVQVRAILMAALAPFPEARAAVASQLAVAEAQLHAAH